MTGLVIEGLTVAYGRIEVVHQVSLTVAEAREIIPGMANAERLIQSRVLKRQFRDHRLEWMIRAGGLQVVIDGLANDDIRFTRLDGFAADIGASPTDGEAPG